MITPVDRSLGELIRDYFAENPPELPLELRQKVDEIKARPERTRARLGCVGCGVPYDRRTRGCRACIVRHYGRARERTNGKPRGKPPGLPAEARS